MSCMVGPPAAELLDRAQPTAVVCASDVLALGVMAETAARGFRVGTDVAVVGFDDTDIGQVSGLSSLAQPLVDVATHSARIVAALLDGSAPTRRPNKCCWHRPWSSAPLRNNGAKNRRHLLLPDHRPAHPPQRRTRTTQGEIE